MPFASHGDQNPGDETPESRRIALRPPLRGHGPDATLGVPLYVGTYRAPGNDQGQASGAPAAAPQKRRSLTSSGMSVPEIGAANRSGSAILKGVPRERLEERPPRDVRASRDVPGERGSVQVGLGAR